MFFPDDRNRTNEYVPFTAKDAADAEQYRDNYDCPCGCGDCFTCTPECGENGQKCPEGKCLGKIKNV